MAPYTRRMPNPARYPHNSCFLTALSQRVSDTTALPSTQKDEGQGVGGLRETALRLGVVPYFPRRFAEIRTRRARPLAIKLTCSTTPPCKAPSAVGASADFSPLEKKNLNAANPEKTGAGGGCLFPNPRSEGGCWCLLPELPASPTQAAGPVGPPPAPCQQVGRSLSLQRPATLLKLHVFTPAELLSAKYLNSSFSKHQEINIRHVQHCEDISPGTRSAVSPTLLVGTFLFLHGHAMAAALVHTSISLAAGSGWWLSGKCHSQTKLSTLYRLGNAALGGTGAEQSWALPMSCTFSR